VFILTLICIGLGVGNARDIVGNKKTACLNAQKISIWLWPTLDRVKGCPPELIEITSLIMLEAGVANKKMSYVPLPSVIGGGIIGASSSVTVAKAAAYYGIKAAGYTLSWVKYLGSSVVKRAVNKTINKKKKYVSIKNYLENKYVSCYRNIRTGLYDAGYRDMCVGPKAKRWLPK
jgi:hypothetical protein